MLQSVKHRSSLEPLQEFPTLQHMKIVFSLSITVDSEDLPESVQTPDAAKASLEDFDFAALISDLANDAEGE